MQRLFGKLLGKAKDENRAVRECEARLSFERTQVDRDLLHYFLDADRKTDVIKDYLAAVLNTRYATPISLQEEVDLLDKYIETYKQLYPDLYLDMDASLEGASSIEPLLLLPLIQNAVKATYFMSEKRPIKCQIRGVGSHVRMTVSNRVNPYIQSQANEENIVLWQSRLAVFYPARHNVIFSSNSNLFRATLDLDLSSIADSNV